MQNLDEFNDLLEQFETLMSNDAPEKPYIDTSDDENEDENEDEIVEKINFCDECNISMVKEQMPDGNVAWMCSSCAKQGTYVYEFDSISGQDVGYNSSDALFVSNGGVPGRSNIVGSSNSYKKLKEKNTRQQLENIISQANGMGISKPIIKKAISSMLSIQDTNIYRGDVRKGTMAACLYRVCKTHGSPLKNTQIAELFGIRNKTLSEGDKKICRLISKGVINESIFHSNDVIVKEDGISHDMSGFIKKYFELLKIPDVHYTEYQEGEKEIMENRLYKAQVRKLEKSGLDDEPMQMDGNSSDSSDNNENKKIIKLKEFTITLIKFMTYFRICSSSNESSKCAGIIHTIALCLPELKITHTMIEKECKISKTTFIKIINTIRDLLYTDEEGKNITKYKLRHIFNKYGLDYHEL